MYAIAEPPARFSASFVESLPTAADLTARMQQTLPDIKRRARETERLGRVPDENLALLRNAGLYRVAQPRLFGGCEQEFEVVVSLVMQAAAVCASTAWVYGLYAAHQWLLANFPLEAQHDVWDDDPNAAVCGSYAPAGKAVPHEGGYRLTGRWAFSSGCDGAQWALCASLLPPKAAGDGPAPAFLLVPAKDYTIEQDWDVAGLAGTGSKTLVLQDVFVPQHRLLTFRDTTGGCGYGSRLHGHPGYGMPMLCAIPSCLAATAVGAAEGALAAYIEATRQRVTRGAVAGANNRMAEFPTIQMRVAEAAACVDAARETLLRDLRAREQTARSGGEISIGDRILSRRGQAFAVSLAVRAIDALNASTGGHGLAMENPVQRAWRDVNAVGRHISLNWDAVGTMYGQHALGLEPKGQY